MSIAKIHAFTAWINIRLELVEEDKLRNVLVDLFQGLHWQKLVETFTGSPFDKIGTFSGISQVQKSARIEWILKELASWKLINEDNKINAKLVAARNSEEVFSLLMKLIHQDIHFLWQRITYLQLEDCSQISKYEFKIIPERVEAAKPKKFKVKKNLLAGFGAASETFTEVIDENEIPVIRERNFANTLEMLSYKRSSSAHNESLPKPSNCLLSIIRSHLKMSKFGKNIKINKLSDLCDVRVLCIFFNAVTQNSFSSEILPNDKWSINLILKTLEKILRIESDFEAADLNSNEDGALTAYFTGLLLMIYKFRQCLKVLEFKDDLEYKMRCIRLSKEIAVSRNETLTNLQIQKNESQMKEFAEELEELKERFNISFCESWKIHQKNILNETLETLRHKINYQYEIVSVQKNTTIIDLCNRNFIFTKNFSCCGYYQLKTIETINDDRKILLRDLKKDKIIVDTDDKAKSKVRFLLKVHQIGPVCLDPETYPRYEIYVDSYSKNKSLSLNDKFLYLLFPDSKLYWKNLLMKSSSNNDLITIKILKKIFLDEKSFINWQDPETGSSALHAAVLNGHLDAVYCLLENGSDVDLRNRYKMSSLFNAVDVDHEKICGVLLEWGANINLANIRNQTVLDTCKNNGLKEFIEKKYKFYSELSESVVNGNCSLLEQLIHDHRTKYEPIFINLGSRCIQGSTILHTAAHFSNILAVKELLILRVDVNQQDYKGASALHRARDLEIINLLLEAGADVNLMDEDKNRALHATCYGDEYEKSQIDKIKMLLKGGADLTARNSQSLMPIHCAAMQGRCDVIELLLEVDQSKKIIDALEEDKSNATPPSMNFLAISGGFAGCAQWLLDRGFNFKEDEANQLLKNIITGELVLHGESLSQGLNLLLYKTGADINNRYPPNSQTALHLAANLSDSTDLLTLLIAAGADLDATDNDHCTPLFILCKRNDMQSARVLINGNASITIKNNIGLTAFDYIPDYLEWINSGLFDEETVARLKAYNLKSTRNTIRSIDKKINSKMERDTSFQLRQLESQLDHSLLEDRISRARSRCQLRPRSVVH